MNTPRLSYIETSALLAALLDKNPAAVRALHYAARPVASALTMAESQRAIVRARSAGKVTPEQEALIAQALQTFVKRCVFVPITDDVLERAGRPFPVEPVRTLDAIHLATAEFLGEPPALITIVTRDERIGKNARAMGYAVA